MERLCPDHYEACQAPNKEQEATGTIARTLGYTLLFMLTRLTVAIPIGDTVASYTDTVGSYTRLPTSHPVLCVGLDQLIRFLVVKLIYSNSNSRFNICVTFTANYLFSER
jgi:hypothetical protein